MDEDLATNPSVPHGRVRSGRGRGAHREDRGASRRRGDRLPRARSSGRTSGWPRTSPFAGRTGTRAVDRRWVRWSGSRIACPKRRPAWRRRSARPPGTTETGSRSSACPTRSSRRVPRRRSPGGAGSRGCSRWRSCRSPWSASWRTRSRPSRSTRPVAGPLRRCGTRRSSSSPRSSCSPSSGRPCAGGSSPTPRTRGCSRSRSGRSAGWRRSGAWAGCSGRGGRGWVSSGWPRRPAARGPPRPPRPPRGGRPRCHGTDRGGRLGTGWCW